MRPSGVGKQAKKSKILDFAALGGRFRKNDRQPDSIVAVNADALSPVWGAVCPGAPRYWPLVVWGGGSTSGGGCGLGPSDRHYSARPVYGWGPREDGHHSRAHPRGHRASSYHPSTLCSTPTTLCTRVGTGFHCTALVMAHCPAPNTGIVSVQSVPSALASDVPGA